MQLTRNLTYLAKLADQQGQVDIEVRSTSVARGAALACPLTPLPGTRPAVRAGAHGALAAAPPPTCA